MRSAIACFSLSEEGRRACDKTPQQHEGSRLTGKIESRLPTCVVHCGAGVARPGTNELSSRGLFDGVRQPADASSEGEQRERRIVRKPASLRHREQRKIEIGKLP